jgi:hypothetical protein
MVRSAYANLAPSIREQCLDDVARVDDTTPRRPRYATTVPTTISAQCAPNSRTTNEKRPGMAKAFRCIILEIQRATEGD